MSSVHDVLDSPHTVTRLAVRLALSDLLGAIRTVSVGDLQRFIRAWSGLIIRCQQLHTWSCNWLGIPEQACGTRSRGPACVLPAALPDKEESLADSSGMPELKDL